MINSPPVSLLPKNPLHTPSHNPTFQPASPQSPGGPSTSPGESGSSSGYIAHHLLPTPSPSHPLKHPDQRFQDSEVFTDKFEKHFSGTMEKVNRRVVKRWGERAQDMSELGGVWNGYSLVEGGKLGLAVEKVGQAVDQEYLATAALVSSLIISGRSFIDAERTIATSVGTHNNGTSAHLLAVRRAYQITPLLSPSETGSVRACPGRAGASERQAGQSRERRARSEKIGRSAGTRRPRIERE